MYHCTNEACSIWLHEECIIDDELNYQFEHASKAGKFGHPYLEAEIDESSTPCPKSRKQCLRLKSEKSATQMKKLACDDNFSASINEVYGELYLQCIDLREPEGLQTWSMPMTKPVCLRCGASLE